MLSDKVKQSINRIKAFEPIDGGGYFLGFSGGKDSCVIKALSDMAGVKYEAHYNVTTVDPPELVRFIREHHPDVIFDVPKYSMRQLIIKNGYPPTRQGRYCCKFLKEASSIGKVTMTGTRWAESVRRKESHGIVTIFGRNRYAQKYADENGADYRETKQGGIVMNMDNDLSRRTVELCYRTNKTLVNPIIDWSDEDVWEFIRTENIPYCKLYDEGWERLGCIGCPLADLKYIKRQFERWPGMFNMYLRTFDDMLKARTESGKDTMQWKTGEDVMDWWLRKAPLRAIEEQITMMEYEQS